MGSFRSGGELQALCSYVYNSLCNPLYFVDYILEYTNPVSFHSLNPPRGIADIWIINLFRYFLIKLSNIAVLLSGFLEPVAKNNNSPRTGCVNHFLPNDSFITKITTEAILI